MKKQLGHLRAREGGRITQVADAPGEAGAAITRRLLEMGFLEGTEVQIAHEAPFGGDPVAVRVRGTLVALRRSEADLIEVESQS